MKHRFKIIITVLLAAWLAVPTFAQDKRTLDTKVVDLLAQFPAQNTKETNRLMLEILELGATGIDHFCGMIIPPGTGNDTQVRYAVAELAQYAGAPGNARVQAMVEKALLKAIDKANDREVKAFFIRRLAYCGESATIKALEQYVNDADLYGPAIATLTSLGTDEAAAVVLNNLDGKSGMQQAVMVKALGTLAYKPAEAKLINLVGVAEGETLDQTYWALAQIGGKASAKVFKNAAKGFTYTVPNAELVIAYLDYATQLAANGEVKLSNSFASKVLKGAKQADQLHFRSAALKVLQNNQQGGALKLLQKELNNSDKAYRNTILTLAKNGRTASQVDAWVAYLPKAAPETKAELLNFLADADQTSVLESAIKPSLNSSELVVRLAAIEALALNQEEKAVPALLAQLAKATDKAELAQVKTSLLNSCSADETNLVVDAMGELNSEAKIVAIQVLGARRASAHFDEIKKLCQSASSDVKAEAYAALKLVAANNNIGDLIGLIKSTNNKSEVTAVQQAIVSLYQADNKPATSYVLNEMKGAAKEKLIPVLPFLQDKNALKNVTSILKSGSSSEKEAAFAALINWTSPAALPVMFDVLTSNSFKAERDDVFKAYVKLAQNGQVPADQRLLWLKKAMEQANNDQEKGMIIRAAGSVKTFLSLVFVSEYLDDSKLAGVASMSAMRIALPSAGENNGLTGEFVRKVLEKVKAEITGPDSQYFKIDIQEYLDKMPMETGYVSIFNGKDLSGWQGLVKNPIARSKMTPAQLAKEQAKADKKMHENWSVKDGSIVFNGKGANLCTKKMYRDFEMIVDWRITKDGDSGIYLRGTPQVQIWDTARVDVGAQVGSGGLYNNQKNPSKPLVLADNAIGDWNTFYIKMVDDKVTVYLNGQLVVDNVTLENYWDRSLPIFREEAIELQAHGTDLAFRNIYVRELSPATVTLSAEEEADGFELLFNGENLDNWIGNKIDYVAENGELVVRPQKGSRGNLYTGKEYSDFIFRFEFQLTEGANNGLGIHAPLEGDVAYLGKELQILDNTAAIYANLKPYQYHGSVYGVITAKRGFLKPLGEWNYQEVIVKGDDVKITLNGEVIVDGNFKEASKNGTLDGKNHPGLKRNSGYIGFLGHGSQLKFRNIRIKDLAK